MNKSRDEFYGALKVLETFPNYLIKKAIEKIKEYVINNLEETRKLDNQIITNLNDEIIELKNKIDFLEKKCK